MENKNSWTLELIIGKITTSYTRYAKKINGKYERFVVNLLPEEYKHICEVISSAGMGKTEFLRWAVNELQKNLSVK